MKLRESPPLPRYIPRPPTADEVQRMFEATDLARDDELTRELRIAAALEREAEIERTKDPLRGDDEM